MTTPAKRSTVLRLLVGLVAGAATGVVAAISLAVTDLYLAGHGHRPLGAPLVDWPAVGIHLSLADAIFLAAVALGATIAWRRAAAGH